jgi:hypothetical protein
VEYSRGLVSLFEAPDQVSWRPAEFVSLLMGARPEPNYLARLLLFPVEDQARKWIAEGELPTADESFARLRAAWEWLGLWDDHVGPQLIAVTGGEPATPAVDALLADVRRVYTTAAEAAAQGRLSAEIASDLARVERAEATLRVIEAPDAAAFAAWCLNRLIVDDARSLDVTTCEICGYPWLRDRRNARYCTRPAPGVRMSCRSVAAQRTYEDEHAEFSRERRRLGQRVRRGLLEPRDYEAWKAANSLGEQGVAWRPYDEWITNQKGRK